MSLFEILIPIVVLIRLVCFDWDKKNGQSVAILVAFMWVMWTISMGMRP